jgi:glutamate synthase domain-containing protein 2
VVQASYKSGAIKEFERHSRLGFVTEESFMSEVARLRALGFKRITLKTGAYSLTDLAMALKFSSKAKIDLLTIDGSSGGTGMSPWRMMEEWGVPSIYLHSAAYEFASILEAQGERVPDLAFAGGFSSEDGVFKALALGAPYTKAVCMGRALMIPGMVGKNIEQWIKESNLPKTVSEFGSTPEEIFVSYEKVKDLVGAGEIKNIPLGAIGIYSYADKIKVGLQQFMAGARKFRLDAITRNEIMSLTEECAKVTNIPYLMDCYRQDALRVLKG